MWHQHIAAKCVLPLLITITTTIEKRGDEKKEKGKKDDYLRITKEGIKQNGEMISLKLWKR